MITTDQNQLKRIQSLTEALSDALTVPHVGEVIISQVLAESRARAGALLLIDANTTLQVVHAVGYKPEVLDNGQRFPLNTQMAVADAMRTGRPIWRAFGETSGICAVPLIVNGRAIGGIGLDFSDAPARSPVDQVFIMLLAQLGAQAIERARLYEAERQARAQAELVRDRLAFLARVNIVLAEDLDYESRLGRIAHLVVPSLADQCAIDILEKNDIVRRVAMTTRNDALQATLPDTAKPDLVSSRLSQFAADVLRTGVSKRDPEFTEENLVTLTPADRGSEGLRESGYTSMMSVPLLARGRILGAITLVAAESGHLYTTDDLVLAEELGRRAGLAVDNARLYSEMQEQHERLQVTLASIGDAVITTDTRGRVTFMNSVAETLTGWKFDESAETHLQDVFYVIHEITRAAIDDPITKVMRENSVVGLGNQPILIAKDGTEMPIDDSGAPIRDERGTIVGVILVFRDISERRQKETALDVTFQRTQDLYETCRRIGLVSSPDEVVQALLTSRYLSHATQCAVLTFNSLWNDERPDSFEVEATYRADAPLPGLAPNGVFDDSPLIHLLSSTDPLFVADTYTDTRLDQANRNLFTPTGIRSVMIFPLTAARRCFGLLALYFSAPQHWSQEDYRHIQVFVDQVCVTMDNVRLFAAEARARLDAEEANAIKLRFLAMISHELRTPLTSIKGFATTLLATDVTWDIESQRDFIAIIDEESDKLTDLIDQLLDLSRLQAGKLRIQPEPRSLSEIIGTAMAQLESVTTQHRLIINVVPDLPLVMVDMQRIAEVLVNLVGNATRYAPIATRITISAAEQDARLLVEVSDEGPGIPVSNREKVFEAFRQLENGPSQQMKGLGLGLAICKGLVEAHGGKIWVADTHYGTTMSFTLPIVIAQ